MRYLAAVITVLAVCLGLPVAGVSAQSAPSSPPAGALTFAETPYWLAGDFRTYWEAHGGLVRFGLPISPPMVDGAGRTVQWLERARFEKHPEVAADNGVLLGLLGVPPAVVALVGTGFCGTLTTFSTFGGDVLRMVEQRRLARGLTYVTASVVLGVGAAALGYLLASG